MKSERFEALVDAVIAIIITIIILEIPLPQQITFNSILGLKMYFFAYFVNFILCYNFWSNHQKFYDNLAYINHQVMWLTAAILFILSFIPFLTNIIINHFNVFFPQLLYGLIFIIIDLLFLKSCYIIKKLDPTNKELTKRIQIITKKISIIILLIIMGIIVGYIYYPPAILYSCFGCLIVSWIMSIKKNILIRMCSKFKITYNF